MKFKYVIFVIWIELNLSIEIRDQYVILKYLLKRL